MKRNRLLVGMTCVAALLLAAGMSDATTVVAKFKGVSPGMNVNIYADKNNDPAYELNTTTQAGIYQFDALSSDFDAIEAGDTFGTFCIDLQQHVSAGGIYTFTVTDVNNAPSPTTYSLSTISEAQELDLLKLYAQYYSLATGGLVVDAAAFQAAVWEIVNEHWLDYDVLDGSFKVRSDWTPAPLANQWLDSLADYTLPPQQQPNLMALLSTCAQDQLILIPGGGGDIPEPLTLAGLLMGLGVIGDTVRRRRTR
jgi:hypothetical protein